jgi:N-acetyl-anhydromuramyl-L-alanine amidase AmpD
MITWLADVLRAAGLKVVEQDGWKTRGKEWPAPPKGVICHHTGGPREGNAPSLHLVENGRPDLAGPLSQLVLGRDGTFFVIAAGRSNHAGAGSYAGITAGNSSFIGIEAENMGTGADPWPAVQMEAYAQGVGAILKHLGQSPSMVCGHKEWAQPKGRKIDPTFDMDQFRHAVASAMSGNAITGVGVETVHPHHDMLKLGSIGASVKELQQKLVAAGYAMAIDGSFGTTTKRMLISYQHDHGLEADGLAGPQTWAALGA